MKRIFSILLAALFVFGLGNSAQATFYGGAMSDLTEMGINLGDTTNGLTATTVTDLFDATGIGATFDGADGLEDITVGGIALNFLNSGRTYRQRDVWFAVEQGTTENDITTFYAMMDTLNTLTTAVEAKTYTDGFYTDTALATSMTGLLNGTYSGFTSNVGSTTLGDLAIGNDVVMDIWSFDNADTAGETDDTLSATQWELVFSIDENSNMVSASLTQVPVPGALILMVTGLLTAVGVRRKKA